MKTTIRLHFVAALLTVLATTASGQTVSNDGSFGYSYPFALPQVRGKYQPSLALSYSSNGSTTNYGVGWELTANYVDASARATRTSFGFQRTRYTLVANGGSRVIAQGTDGAYHPDVSQSYFKLSQDDTTTWTGHDGIGNTFTYKCQGGLASCSRWYLTSVADPDNNMTWFDYALETSGACTAGATTPTALLTRVRYNFGAGTGASTPVAVVNLTYGPTDNAEVEAVNGCMVTHSQVLTSVSMTRATSASTTIGTGSWTISYDNSPDTHRKRLIAVQTNDRNGAALGSPTTFTYESNSPSATPANGPVAFSWSNSNGLDYLTPSQQGWWAIDTAQHAAAFIDVDGDGLPDMVWGGKDICGTCAPGSPNPGLRWARNLSSGNGTPVFSDVHIMSGSQDWPGSVTALNTDATNRALNGTSGTPSTSGTYDLTYGDGLGAQTLYIDVNGDGAPDLIDLGSLCGQNSITVRLFDTATGGFKAAVCANATAAFAKIQSLFGIAPTLGYSVGGPRPFTGSGAPTNTWVAFEDFTGDGYADLIVADPGATPVWYVYPGYAGANGFQLSDTPIVVNPVTAWPQTSGSTNAYPIRTSLGAMAGSVFDAASPPYSASELLAGRVEVDFIDINGDGLPDRVVAIGDVISGIAHWYVDYNTGKGFAQVSNGSLPGGEFQDGLPVLGPWVSTPDIAFVDLNRDGRPDFVARYDVSGMTNFQDTSCASAASDNLMVWSNAAAGLEGNSGYVGVPCWPNIIGRQGFRPYQTFQQGPPADLSIRAAYNEGFYDIDGDGIMDYMRAPDASEGFAANTWLMYRGVNQTRRSDILTSMTTATGLKQALHWSPSTPFGTKSGLASVSDVVVAIDQSGPAMSPMTISYSYSTLQTTIVWDDPGATQVEPLGFAQQTSTPSVGGTTQQITYGANHPTSGMPIATCVGTAALPCSASTSPSVTDRTTTTWATSSYGLACLSGVCYPLYLYASANSRFRSELSASAVAVQTTSPLDIDAFGNILSFTATGDALSSSGTTTTVTRAFAAGAGSNCPSCMIEETVTDPASGAELAHTYYHYDLPAGSSSNARSPGTVSLGHLSYVEALVSGSGSTGVFESPSITYYSTSGNVSSVVKSYSAQLVTSVTESIVYDPFDDASVVSRSVSDNSAAVTLTTTYSYTPFGDLAQMTGPAASGTGVGGSPPPSPIVARAYDSAGRIIAEAAQPIAGGMVSSPLRAYEYILPTSTTPAAVKTYSFAAGASSFTAGSVPQNDDSTQTIAYADPFGRTVQVRTRLGSGTAPTNSAGNVVKSLSAQYSVRSNVLLDGLGRATASLEPYFSATGSYVDPRTSAELSIAGLHATVVAYDTESRPTCSVYEPVSGALLPAPDTAAACLSTYSEDSSYRRATRLAYGTDGSLDSRLYMTVDTTGDWAASTSTPERVYLDAMGRPHYAKMPSGTFEQKTYDLLGRVTSTIRYPGAPGSSSPTVTSTWTYDKRGRVSTEFADAAGYRSYQYLPTGEMSQVLQNPNVAATTSDALSVWSVQKIGSLGRIVERDDFRRDIGGDCNGSLVQDTTTFDYDVPWTGDSRYGYTAGHLTAALTATSTVALGYNNLGLPTIRDEWVSGISDRQSIVDTRGADGRLLTRAMTSSYLAGFNSISTFGYAVGYDSAGNPVQVNSTYDAAGVFHAITAAAAGSAYWVAGAGTGGTDPTTGPFDALGRLTAEKWDAGAVTKSRSYLTGSNFSSGHSTTLTTPGTNVYTVSAMSWQGSLLAGYSVSSAWDGGGTTHAATYDADAHLQQWTATPFGASGTAQQKFGEGYTFSLENLQTVNTTNNLGFNVTATYNYGDATSAERVTSISVPNAPTMDTLVYDRRGRGLLAQHKLSATQTIAQDAYEYDSQNRLTSISHLGAKLEDLAYDGAGDLVSRTFPTGAAEIARYYVGEQLSLVNRSATTKLGYAHIQLGGRRIASFWVKSASGTNTNGVIYYHRDRRNDVVATTKNGGAMGVSYRYLPYGAIDKVVSSTGSALTPGTEADDVVSELGFIGGLKLSGGLIHLKARAYSPTMRRFLQPDIIDLKRYSYSNGDPLNFSDPSGLTPNKDKSNDPASIIDPNQTAPDGAANKTQSQTTVTTGQCGAAKCEVDTVTGTRQKGGCDGGNCAGPAGPSVPLAPPAATQGPNYLHRVWRRIVQTNQILNPLPNAIGKRMNNGGQGLVGALGVPGKIKDAVTSDAANGADLLRDGFQLAVAGATIAGGANAAVASAIGGVGAIEGAGAIGIMGTMATFGLTDVATAATVSGVVAAAAAGTVVATAVSVGAAFEAGVIFGAAVYSVFDGG